MFLYHRRYGFVHGVSYNFFKEVVVFIRISKNILVTLTTFKSTIKTQLFRIAFKALLRWTDIFVVVKLTFKCNFNDCSIIIQLIVLYSLYICIYF